MVPTDKEIEQNLDSFLHVTRHLSTSNIQVTWYENWALRRIGVYAHPGVDYVVELAAYLNNKALCYRVGTLGKLLDDINREPIVWGPFKRITKE